MSAENDVGGGVDDAARGEEDAGGGGEVSGRDVVSLGRRVAADAVGGAGDVGQGVDSDVFRKALARWASGVVVAAVRDGGRVYATTATAFASISLEPPLVLLSLGPGAQVLPFLDRGAAASISVLAADQRRFAEVFADAFPVGRSPFPDAGPALLPGALAGLVCRVRDLHEAGDHRLVVAQVEEASLGGAGEGGALIYWQRGYRAME